MVSTYVTEEQSRKLRWVAEQLETQGLRQESHVLQAVLDEMSGQSASVSSAEAAEILSVTQQTIRNWVRAGILAGGRDATGHFYVFREALASAVRMRHAVNTNPSSGPVIQHQTLSLDSAGIGVHAVDPDGIGAVISRRHANVFAGSRRILHP